MQLSGPTERPRLSDVPQLSESHVSLPQELTASYAPQQTGERLVCVSIQFQTRRSRKEVPVGADSVCLECVLAQLKQLHPAWIPHKSLGSALGMCSTFRNLQPRLGAHQWQQRDTEKLVVHSGAPLTSNIVKSHI